MTFFSLARKNMKGNFNNYFLYFVTLVFCMVIYYTFASLQYSKKIQESIELSDTMSFMFGVSSIVLMVFVAIFILYSNSFFTTKRKKEVGLYAILGLRKKTIAKMLFYENLMMGIIALVLGIILGTLLSKLFAMILIKLMGATAEVDFGISILAITQTIIVFMVIILFTSVQAYRLIYRFKLIELFHAEKKGEQIPKISLIPTMIGMVLLVSSYWLIIKPFPDEFTTNYLLRNYGIAFIALIIGTQLFFRSVTVYLLKRSQNNKARYYRGTRLIETSRLLFRMSENARTFTVIALLSAATISFIGVTYSGYYSNETRAKEVVPFSYSHLSKGQEFDSQVESIITGDHKHPTKAQLDIPVIQIEGNLSFQLDYDINPVKLISENTFNQATEALHKDEIVSLSGNQVAVIQPRFTEYTKSVFQDESITLQLPHGSSNLQFVQLVESNVLPFDYPDFFLVVSNEMFAKIASQKKPLTYKVYEVENELATQATSEKVNKLVGKDFQVSSSFYTEYKQGKEGNALTLFIFGFLGLVFLAATGSTIYFKQLTEANATKGDYEILRKIGVNKKEIRQSIKRQSLFVFGLPLTVGILHSCVILYFTSNFISNLIGINLIVPILMAIVLFIIIYAIYYVLTVNTYNGIVNK